MIKLKTPAIFLSFDDKFIKEWFDLLGFLREFDMKVTFYISVLYSKIGDRVERKPITDEEWGMLKEIRANGHTIGYHGYHHLNMQRVIKESGTPKAGRRNYINQEINTGVEIFKKNDFNIRHFSYPYGVHEKIMDKYLLKRFDTLRLTVGRYDKEDDVFYDRKKLDRMRIFCSLSLERKTDEENKEILSVLKNLTESDNKILFVRMHRPDDKIMKRLLSCRENGVNFYSMGIFENR